MTRSCCLVNVIKISQNYNILALNRLLFHKEQLNIKFTKIRIRILFSSRKFLETVIEKQSLGSVITCTLLTALLIIILRIFLSLSKSN